MTTTAVVTKNAELIPATTAKTFGDLITKSDLVQRCADALPKHLTPERWWRAVLTAINKTPKLRECTVESVMDCMLEVAQTGLQIGGALGESYLIPFKGKCTVVYGWKGLVKLCYNGGAVKSITCDVVYEQDAFEYERGTTPKLRHVPSPSENPGAIIASYAVAHLADGGIDFEILWPRDIKKIRAVSRATSGPWFDWEEQMWKKSAVRRLQNRLPKASDAQIAIANEDARMERVGVYRVSASSIGAPAADQPGDIEMEPEVATADERKISSLLDLFESKQISQGAGRTAFIAKVAKAANIALKTEGGKLPALEDLPEALVDALIEELSK